MTGTITYILSRAGFRAMNGPLADERRRLAGAEPPAAYVSYDPRLLAGAGWYGYRIALKGGDRDMVRRALAMLADYYIIRDGYEYYEGGVYIVGVLLRQRVPHYGIGGGEISHDNDWYGVEVDTTVLNPALLRIGKEELHRELPIQNGMRRCMLLDDGTVNYYLDDTDSTKKADGTAAVLDGTDGQVMVEIPAHYRKIEIEGTKQRVKFSQYPLEGYTYVPDMYISAFEAVLDRTNSKLASVVNTTAQYRGGNNTSGWDGTYRSLLGKPVTSISLTSFRTYARNRGTNWACQDLHVYTEMWLLYLVEYANRNCQLAYNPNLDANGYRQGGLGYGVTTTAPDKWNSYNSYNPFIPCGATLSLGNNTGVVSYAVPSATEGAVWETFNVPSYRGVENPFGHVWKWTDGILVNIAASGTSDVYVCDNPTKYASSLTADYNKVGEEARTTGFTQNVIFPYPIANQVSGSSATGYCDYHNTYMPSSGSSLRGVFWGGNAYYGAYAGFAFASSIIAPSATDAIIGSRLCYRA